ncbi:MAG: hypothetical protein IJX19_06305 [Clostridia bacterium]|nr:hypothetical protein [Clostridia bacterium]
MMKFKNALLSLLLLAAILLTSCAQAPKAQSNTESPSTAVQTEAPTPPADPFAAVRESDETWISYGLAAYESGKEIENLKHFFTDLNTLSYLTLYDHMFVFDKEKSIPIAEALFSFIYNEYGADALLDIEKRCEYKTAYLRSLGLELEYIQDPRVESFLASMAFSSNKTYQYIISFDNVTYYFKDFNEGAPAAYHGFLYYNTTGLFEMIDYLKNNGLSEGLNTERKFQYFMTFDGSGISKTTYANGNMYINDYASALHEAVHAMGIGTANTDHIWLSEGICNYFGKVLGFNDQLAASYIQILTMTQQGKFDELASAGNQSAIIYKKIHEKYTNRGGRFDSIDTFDLGLYIDIGAKIELELGSSSYSTLGSTYEALNKKECTSVGAELSYAQATSMIGYLADTYGINKVLEAYRTQKIDIVFGKTYEELKALWLEHLQENVK